MLKELRLSRNLDQTDMERAAGLRPSAISQVETGKRNIGSDALDRLADDLHLPADLRDRLHAARKARKGTPPVNDQAMADVHQHLSAIDEQLQQIAARVARLERQ